MKKLLVIIGVIFFLFLAVAVIVPLVVDVDKYRPQISEMVNEKINGKLELGKLSLSLWGQIRVEIGGLNLLDAQGTKLITVKEAYFHIPFLSVLSGSPSLVFKMQNPAINVVKNKAGKMSITSLMKSASQATPGAPSSQSSTPIALPAIAVRSKLDVDIRNADLTYKDLADQQTTQIKDLNLIVHDISLSRPMALEMWAEIDYKKNGSDLTVKGPIKLLANAKPEVASGAFDHLTMTAKLDMNNLEILMPGTFHKKKGVDANVDLSAFASQKEMKIQNIVARFFNAEIKASGSLSNLSGENSSAVVNFGMKSNEIDLKPWVELIPMLADFQLTGTARIEGGVNGPTDKLGYSGKLQVANMTAKSSMLKVTPRIDGLVNIATDKIESMNFSMKAPGSEVEFKGKMVSFTSPRADFELSSSGIDLDQLVDFKAMAAKKSASLSVFKEAYAAKTEKSDLDASVAPLRESKMIRNMVANMGVNIKQMKAYDVKLTDLLSRLSFRDLVAGLDQFSFKLWSGSVKVNAAIDMKPKMPTYKFSTGVDGLDMAQAVASQLQLFKNTVVGKANFSMNGEGASFNTDAAMSNLKGKGTMKINQATFATIDVGRMTTEALNKAIDRIAQKYPAIANKKVNGLPNRESKYEYVSSDFTIAGGVFSAPNLVGKAETGKGIDLKGDTQVGMKDSTVKARWELIDTYNLTHAKDLSVNIAGSNVDHILAEGNGPVKFPVSMSGALSSPAYNYGEVPEFLMKVAANNVTQAATGRAKSEAKKQAESLIKQAPPAVQKPLQDLGKKLFGR